MPQITPDAPPARPGLPAAQRRGRLAGSTCTATCCKCGTTEEANGGSATYRCAGCRDKMAAEILALSDAGYSQGQIAVRMGMSQNTVSTWCIRFGITTRFAKPAQEDGPVIGFRKQAPKLMPSSRALGLVSIFSVGV